MKGKTEIFKQYYRTMPLQRYAFTAYFPLYTFIYIYICLDVKQTIFVGKT